MGSIDAKISKIFDRIEYKKRIQFTWDNFERGIWFKKGSIINFANNGWITIFSTNEGNVKILIKILIWQIYFLFNDEI